ncbi:MAG: HAMP domain-containing histidine kinase [Leptospiraceae bacterium]|nr:HAMP domain-containing histidine kinase [Leptospiraceae bacterium]MCP5511101.1 HAMP domain-containing histidine kinase [Leptospiraceae bacterium]
MQKISGRVVIGILWLVLSVSIGTWWAVMGIRQANSIAILQKSSGTRTTQEAMEYLEKQQRMIKLEGAFFLSLLTSGGLALIMMSVRDIKRNQVIKDFFATVTHEMKTPLASLRLQAESLEEEITQAEHKKLIKRLIEDAGRLELQMDKALYLASISREESLYMERLKPEDILFPFQNYYENLSVKVESTDFILCDRRALESIIKNLIENSYHHGEATEIEIRIQSHDQKVNLDLIDNGKGFDGDRSKIGKLFYRHNSRSGSGIGLFLSKNLLKKMDAEIHFPKPDSGFQVKIRFPIASDRTPKR